MADKGGMTVKEAGRKGGRATKARHGGPGSKFYQNIGRKGGEETKRRHGPEGFYETIGREGGRRVRQLVARGRRVEQNEKKEKK